MLTEAVHVLLSRPRPKLDELTGLLRAAGLEPVPMPAFTFEALDHVPLEDFLSGDLGLLVFTSPRAVEFAFKTGAIEIPSGISVAALGPATATELVELGMKPIMANTGRFTSEELLKSTELAGNTGRALIVTAPGGRQALGEGLASLGWQVDQLDVYRRIDLAPVDSGIQALRSAVRLASIWTSATAMTSILDTMPTEVRERLLRAPMVVISNRLKKIAMDRGANAVTVSDIPGNEGLLETLLQALALNE